MAQIDKKVDKRSRPKEEWSPARKAALERFVAEYAGQGAPQRVSDKDIAKTLIDTGGCVNRTAKILGYNTPWVGQRIKRSAELTEVLTQARAGTVHAVSEGLIDAALKVGNDPRYFNAAKLVLELYGKPHGIDIRGDVVVEHTGTVTQKVDEAQVEAFKAALERAVIAQSRQKDETIDVD